MTNSFHLFAWFSLGLILPAVSVRAQSQAPPADSSPGNSQAPYAPLMSWANSADAQPGSSDLTPDDRPLSGVQQLTLGQYTEVHSYILPSISVTTQLDSNPLGSGHGPVSSVSYLLGRVNLEHSAGHSELFLDYAGGGTLSNDGSSGDSVIQDLEFSDRFQWQRWSLLVGDETAYLSQSPFGFGGVGGVGFLGGIFQSGSGGIGSANAAFLNPAITPSQTISTADVARMSNLSVTQLDYKLSGRSSWTAAGGYALLHFFGSGYVNSSNLLFQTGFNHQIGPLDSIAVLYRLDDYRFSHLAQGIEDHVAELSYARRITGRMSFQFAAGPELEVFKGAVIGSSNQLSWTVNSSLNYQYTRTSLSLTYDHLLTAGSGILVGAETDQVQAALNRPLSQTWQGRLSLGYASNRALAQTSTSVIQTNPSQPRFNYWYGTVQFSHQVRTGIDLFMAYQAQLQGSATAACGSATCTGSSVTHELSFGLNWGLRPIPLH